MTSHDKSRNNLLGKFQQLAEQNCSAPCRIGEIHSRFDKETGEAFIKAMQSGAPTMSIYRALKDEGFQLGRQTLSLYRKCFQSPTDGDCKCFPNNTGA